MKIAIMQPYLLPYIGYWQLIACSDVFVLLDDVNFKPRSWISRNRYYCDCRNRLFHIPVSDASQNRLIQDTQFLFIKEQRVDLISTFQYAYRKAPYREAGSDLLREILMNQDTDVTSFLLKSMTLVMNYLQIDSSIMRASCLRSPQHARKAEGIIELCKSLGADIYVNLPGGRRLYSRKLFQSKQLELRFLEPDKNRLQLLSGSIPFDLSIIDLIMRFSPTEIIDMLSYYSLCL